MKTLSILAMVIICLSVINCDQTKGGQCTSALVDAYSKVDLPPLFGLWCQLIPSQQTVILEGLISFTNGVIPDEQPLVTLFGQLSSSQLRVVNEAFIQLGLLSKNSPMIGIVGQEVQTKKFIHDQLLPLVLGFFALPLDLGSN